MDGASWRERREEGQFGDWGPLCCCCCAVLCCAGVGQSVVISGVNATDNYNELGAGGYACT